MILIRCFFVAVIGVLSSGAAAAQAIEPLGLKGLQLGASITDIKKHYPKADCTLTSSCLYFERLDRTKNPATIAGAPLSMILFKLHEGKLSGIFMSPSSSTFTQVSTAFIDKYGKPDMRTSTPVRTPAGAEYQNEMLVWKKPAGVIRIERFDGDIKNSAVTFQTYDDVSRGLAAKEATRKAAAGDL